EPTDRPIAQRFAITDARTGAQPPSGAATGTVPGAATTGCATTGCATTGCATTTGWATTGATTTGWTTTGATTTGWTTTSPGAWAWASEADSSGASEAARIRRRMPPGIPRRVPGPSHRNDTSGESREATLRPVLV